MTAPDQAIRRASKSPTRRIAVAVAISLLIFALLWVMVFGMVTSALISGGCCVIVVTASSLSDTVEMLLDAIAAAVFGVLAIIAAIFGALFSLLGP